MDPIARVRLKTQGISHPAAGQPVDVVRTLLAVQSQDYLGGKWSVALRLKDVTDTDLDADLDAGRILRTHILRPTWHFVLPEDIRWLLELTSPRVLAQNASMARKLGLDARTVSRGLDAIARALEGGNWRTRQEIGEVLGRARVKEASGQRLAYVVMQAELEGLIASGPRRGKQFTYGLLAERAPGGARAGTKVRGASARDEALARLATRYLAGHGPATVHDLARWASLTLADAARGMDAAEVARPAAVTKTATGGAVRGDHLLCVYDEYVNGYRDRSAIFDPAHAAAITHRGAAVTQVYILDGQVLGTWSRTLGKDRVGIELQPFDARMAARTLIKRLTPSAEAFARFVGLEPGLTVA